MDNINKVRRTITGIEAVGTILIAMTILVFVLFYPDNTILLAAPIIVSGIAVIGIFGTLVILKYKDPDNSIGRSDHVVYFSAWIMLDIVITVFSIVH